MMAFVDGEAIALATSHQLSISPSILEDRTKDDGDNPVAQFDTYTWTISTESIVGYNDEVEKEETVVGLIDKMLAMAKVGICTDAAQPDTGSVPASGWEQKNMPLAYSMLSGTAYIDSLSVSAGTTGFATASISFKGQSELSSTAQ